MVSGLLRREAAGEFRVFPTAAYRKAGTSHPSLVLNKDLVTTVIFPVKNGQKGGEFLRNSEVDWTLFINGPII